MSRIFQLPRQVPLVSGAVSPGAKANFFLTGTTTPTNTYTDAALTVPSTNPVIANAAGEFATIYLDPDVVYKLTLDDTNDALIYTEDPIQDALTQANIGLIFYPQSTAEISAGVTPTNFFEIYGNVLRYGAVAEAVPTTDNSTAVINCFKANNSAHFPYQPGIWGFTSQVATTITGDITITGINARLRVLSGVDSTLDSEGIFRHTVTGSTGNSKYFIDGVDFDGNELATHGLVIVNADVTTTDANLMTVEIGSRCSFRDFKEPAAGGGAVSCSINGWFQKVIFGGQCYNITSDDPTPDGTAGLFVGAQELAETDSFTRTTVIQGTAVFDNIQTDIATESNGIFVAGPDTSPVERGALIVQAGVQFRNCKTRSIKSQVRHNIINGAQFFRDTFGTDSSYVEVDLQRAGGSVLGCEFFYDGVEVLVMVNAAMRVSDTDSKLVCLGNQVFVENVTTPTISKFFETFAQDGDNDYTADKVVINDNVVRGKIFQFGLMDVSGATTQNGLIANNNRVDHIEAPEFVEFKHSSAGSAYYKVSMENNWQKTDTGATIFTPRTSSTKVTPYLRNNHNLPAPVGDTTLPSVDAILQFEKGDFYPNPFSDVGDISGWQITTAGKPGTWTPVGQTGLKDNAGDPNSSVTPDFVGQMVRDTSATPDDVYIAVGTANTDWEQITA